MSIGIKQKHAFFALVVSVLIFGFAHGVTLEAFPKILNNSGDNITLEWKDISSPSAKDWAGIYSPPDSADDNFIGFIFLSSCPNWTKGACSINLPLINLRSPYEFRLFHWDNSVNAGPVHGDRNPLPSSAHFLAKSESVTFQNLNDPAQIHLAFTSNQDEMRVMFVTKDNLKSYVKHGLRKEELEEVAEAVSITYKQSDMCDAPANTSLGWREPGYIHDAVMRRLKPGKRYFYQGQSVAGASSDPRGPFFVPSTSPEFSTRPSTFSTDAEQRHRTSFTQLMMSDTPPHLRQSVDSGVAAAVASSQPLTEALVTPDRPRAFEVDLQTDYLLALDLEKSLNKRSSERVRRAPSSPLSPSTRRQRTSRDLFPSPRGKEKM